MKILLSKYFWILILWFSGIQFGHSQWVQADGPHGAIQVNEIIYKDSISLVSTNNGIYLTDSIRGRWRFLTNAIVSVHTIVGNTIYLGHRGVSRIDLGGTDYQVIPNGLGSKLVFSLIKSDSCLYVGTQRMGIYKSVGYSGKWESINGNLPCDSTKIPDRYGGGYSYIRHVHAIQIKGDSIFIGTQKGLFNSQLNSIHWFDKTEGLPAGSVYLIKLIDDAIIVGIGNKLYKKSMNSGWVQFFSSNSKISGVHEHLGLLYISTYGEGIYQSKVNDQGWTRLDNGLHDLNVRSINSFDSMLVCGTQTDGLNYLEGDVWVKNNNGIIVSRIDDLININGELVARSYEKIFHYNNDYEWEDISPEYFNPGFMDIDKFGNSLIVSGRARPNEGSNEEIFILNSNDVGQNWSEIPLPNIPTSLHFDPFIYASINKLYTYSGFLMYYSTDLSGQWADISLSNRIQFCCGFEDVLDFNNRQFMCTGGDAQIGLLDTGGNWVIFNIGLPMFGEVESLMRTSDAMYSYVRTKGIYVSRNGGDSWRRANIGLDDDTYVGFSVYKDHVLFISTTDGVFYTDSYGDNWHPLNEGLFTTATSGIEIINDTIFVGTKGYGVWKRSLSGISTSIDVPREAGNLWSMYPNPCSDVVNIKLLGNMKAHILIYNNLGQAVAESTIATQASISLSHLQEGTYYLVLETKDNWESKKLIICR